MRTIGEALPLKAHSSPTAVKRNRESYLQVKGAGLFNLVTKDLRGITGVSVDTFKATQDGWLSDIPDRAPIQGRQRAALNISLIDQAVSNH